MIKKLCSYPGCHKVVEAGVKYCDKHRETDRKKYREYKQRRMRDEQEARRQQFYNSKAWEQFRAAQAAAQLGIDISAETQQKILCAYVSNGIYTPNEARLELQRQKLPDGDELIVNAGVLKLKDIGKKEEGSGSNANE